MYLFDFAEKQRTLFIIDIELAYIRIFDINNNVIEKKKMNLQLVPPTQISVPSLLQSALSIFDFLLCE